MKFELSEEEKCIRVLIHVPTTNLLLYLGIRAGTYINVKITLIKARIIADEFFGECRKEHVDEKSILSARDMLFEDKGGAR